MTLISYYNPPGLILALKQSFKGISDNHLVIYFFQKLVILTHSGFPYNPIQHKDVSDNV